MNRSELIGKRVEIKVMSSTGEVLRFTGVIKMFDLEVGLFSFKDKFGQICIFPIKDIVELQEKYPK